MPVLETEPKPLPSVEPTLEQLRAKKAASSVMALRRAEFEPDPLIKKAIFEHVYNQETTHLCEILEGKVETEVEFETIDGKLYAVDETGLTDWEKFHENNWQYANLLVEQNPKLEPYLRISEADTEEGIAQIEMVKAGEPKTMVKLSLCGDDILDEQALLKLGRDPLKKRAMLRVSIFDGAKLKLYTRSIDNMSLEGGKEFYKHNFNIEIPNDYDSADLLSMSVAYDEVLHNLADELVPSQAGINTYQFVNQQQDLLKVYFESLNGLAQGNLSEYQIAFSANELRYDIMSSFKKRLRGDDVYASADAIISAGNEDRARGETHNGCDDSVTSLQSKTGLGLKSNEQKTDCVTCPNCSKVVNLDKEYFRAGFLRCPSCKATKAYKKGAKLPQKKHKRYNEAQEGFFEWWTKQKQLDKLKRQR